MKRIKVMFTAITVLAVVGGALAFKAANKFGTLSYCTAASSGQCNAFTTNSRITTGDHILIYAVETSNTSGCSGINAPQCNQQLKLTNNQLP